MIAATPPCAPLENPLWLFSLDFYRQPRVANFLLDCQDNKNADVCLLLWASYISFCGRQLSEKRWLMADSALRRRRRAIVGVRFVRRALGALGLRGSAYRWCKSGELGMEQRQLAQLWQLEAHWPENKSPLQLAAVHYNFSPQTRRLWASLISAYANGNGRRCEKAPTSR